ncbi:MAG TPA: alpha-amylase family glycosyl hydrolase [Caulobacteraceae bacterium]|nr:alpha-amylase family glycosyl hydrolase [Caulobacteraceae bacterium]
MSDPGGDMPQWWRGAVIYQVYPRSFRDSNGDGVGDLRGVIAGLDHIASLGVDALWLSPFYRSPMKDFGYDVSDYRDVDPQFGTLADFDELLAQAHRRGLKVIVDQVWAHTSDEHAWFKASAASRDGEKADWYVWADAKPDGSPPNNWQAAFGGPSWTWAPARRQYYFHNFLVEQPDLNYWNSEVREEILNVAHFWLDRGVDGFRLDVVNYIVHDRELRDNPVAEYSRSPSSPTYFQKHVFDRSRPEALAFLARLRHLMDGYPDRMTVGEIVDPAPFERQQQYTSPPDGLDTAYTFHFLSARTPTTELFERAIEGWSGAAGWPSWSLGNHDVDRYASRLARDDPRLTRTLLAALMCLRGTIFLYQGEELGLPQAQVPRDLMRDPFAIAAYDGGAFRDGARTPIPWTADGPSAGFSASGETWLPIDSAHRPLAIAQQEGREDSMLAFTRRLIALRRSSRALQSGEARLAPAGQDGVLAFERRTAGEALLCLFELGGADRRVEIPRGARVVFDVAGARPAQGGLDLPAFGTAILRVDG